MTTSDTIEFWGVILTGVLGIAALAGTAVAIVLSATANKREAKRDAEQDRDRVDRWLAEFLVEATAYWAACDTWVSESRKIEEDAFASGYNGDPDELPEPKRPSAARMLALLDAARLVARGEERSDLKSVSDCVNRLRNEIIPMRSAMVWKMTDAVRDWRSGNGSLVALAEIAPAIR